MATSYKEFREDGFQPAQRLLQLTAWMICIFCGWPKNLQWSPYIAMMLEYSFLLSRTFNLEGCPVPLVQGKCGLSPRRRWAGHDLGALHNLLRWHASILANAINWLRTSSDYFDIHVTLRFNLSNPLDCLDSLVPPWAIPMFATSFQSLQSSSFFCLQVPSTF